MQKAISVQGYWREGKYPYNDTTELNKLLEEGWKVVFVTEAKITGYAGGNTYSSGCYVSPLLVILEKQ